MVNKESETLPGYQILGRLGVGGMGIVFKALEVKSNRLVAIKIIYPKTARNISLFYSFQRESALLIKFNHSHIVKGYYVTPPEGVNGIHYSVMEYVEGESVQQLIDQARDKAGKIAGLNEELSLLIIMQVADALDYLQKQNILHRDIKPDNLLLNKKIGIIKLCDLGFAQSIVSENNQDERAVTTSGTIGYMSPEQSRGQMTIDIRSDIYSLGATLYHMITGKPPFTGTNNLEVMAQQVLANIKSDEIKNRRISPLVLYFIEKMMAKEKEIRYQTPQEIITDIRTQMDGFKSLEFHPD
ncbi:MAG: serine/threonine-protein kinase [Planctomycetota bacterium]